MTLLSAFLQVLQAQRYSSVERTRPFELLSIGAVATTEESLLRINDVLATVAPIRLSVMTDDACHGEGHCMPWGSHMVLPNGFFASMHLLKIRWDESFDAIVARLPAYDQTHLNEFARYAHGLLRVGGLLVLGGYPAAGESGVPVPFSEEWLTPWFAGAAVGGTFWAGTRRPPKPAAALLPARHLGDLATAGALNCTARGFQALSRKQLAELKSLGRTMVLLQDRGTGEPVDGHNLALHFVLAIGRSLRSFEDAVTAAVAHCPVPAPPLLELALAETFESLARSWRRLQKLRFRLWTMHSPEGGVISRSARYAGVVFQFAQTVLKDALRPVAALQDSVAKAAALLTGETHSVSDDQPSRENNAWLVWLPKGDGGEMPLTEIVYRRVFDGQQLDRGMLPVLVAEVFARGDAVADFGASLGEYASFFNSTGLVTAFAFDGTEGIAEVTKGQVLEVKLDQPFTLWRTFDWVICLEVLEHIPQEFERAALENLRRHASKGAVISWGNEWSTFADAGHVNGKSEEYARAALGAVGFVRDEAVTERLRRTSRLWWVAETIAAYRVL
mmetsp:Transcript_20789/g.58543  ORF Transcript_20789/g.58543 Transcript_20789/m.58543 type:complete len:560 (-) Transcript_20789:234-1913(-)